MNRTSGNLPTPDYYEGDPKGFEVFSWCPTPTPTVPATQVHLHVHVGQSRIIVRFKGPRTLDALIDALLEHRRDVFGAKP